MDNNINKNSRKRDAATSRSRNRKSNSSRKKRRVRVNYFKLITSLCIFILLVFGIFWLSKQIFSKKQNTPETKQEETVRETKSPELSTKDQIDLINEKIEGAEKELVKRINSYIENNSLDKERINFAFKSLQNNSKIIVSNFERIPMKNYNIFIISMLAEDLRREGKLDFNDTIDISKYSEDEQQNKFVSIGKLIEDMIIRGGVWRITAVKEKIEDASRTEWKTLANKRYQLEINTHNAMSFNNLLSVLERLYQKENDEYRYKETLQTMLSNAEISSNVYYLANNYFLGYLGAQEFEYNVESAIILGNKPYVYSIYTNYSEESISSEIRKIINEWVNDFY